MDIYMIWGQRVGSYLGQYAAELLESVDEYTDEDNGRVFNDNYREYCASDEFESVVILKSNIADKTIYEALKPTEVKMSNTEVVKQYFAHDRRGAP